MTKPLVKHKHAYYWGVETEDKRHEVSKCGWSYLCREKRMARCWPAVTCKQCLKAKP